MIVLKLLLLLELMLVVLPVKLKNVKPLLLNVLNVLLVTNSPLNGLVPKKLMSSDVKL